MEWLFVIGVLIWLYAFHTYVGQYIINPGRRTRDHVRHCTDCRLRLLRLTPVPGEDSLCPEGQRLLDKYGAWP